MKLVTQVGKGILPTNSFYKRTHNFNSKSKKVTFWYTDLEVYTAFMHHINHVFYDYIEIIHNSLINTISKI